MWMIKEQPTRPKTHFMSLDKNLQVRMVLCTLKDNLQELDK